MDTVTQYHEGPIAAMHVAWSMENDDQQFKYKKEPLIKVQIDACRVVTLMCLAPYN